MGIKSIERAAKKADRLMREHKALCEKIETELEKITGIDCLKVCNQPGDGIGVCLEKDNNCDSAGLPEVLSKIHKNGTITEDEILDLTFF